MPQVFQVLCCCSCELFQVHQVKKSKKWECKVCKEKQSLIKAYKIGTAPDCRSLVQQLNLKRGEENSVQLFNENSEFSTNAHDSHNLVNSEEDIFDLIAVQERHFDDESMALSCDINDGNKIRSVPDCMDKSSVQKTRCLSTSDFKNEENSSLQQRFKEAVMSSCKLNGVTDMVEMDVSRSSINFLHENNESSSSCFTSKEKTRFASETFMQKCVTKRNRGFQKIVNVAKCQVD